VDCRLQLAALSATHKADLNERQWHGGGGYSRDFCGTNGAGGDFSIRPVGLLIVPTAIQSYISIEVQLLAVTVTEAVLKTLPSTLKFWSLACVTECGWYRLSTDLFVTVSGTHFAGVDAGRVLTSQKVFPPGDYY
jgi:hypothetical protein